MDKPGDRVDRIRRVTDAVLDLKIAIGMIDEKAQLEIRFDEQTLKRLTQEAFMMFRVETASGTLTSIVGVPVKKI